MDTQGVGISSGSRFVSDPLRFTGVDLGDRETAVVRRGHYEDSEDEDDEDTSSSEDEEFGEYIAQLAIRDPEEALVQSAMHRIERAKAKGRTDVDLNNEELAALDRRRKRMEEEARRKKRSGKKRKEQRVAIPLTQLEPTSRKKKAPPVSQSRHESRTRQSSSNSNLGEDPDHSGYPPMGYFPPPATAGRPRPGTASSQRTHSRARAPSTSRHASDASGRGVKNLPPYGDIPIPGGLDPFQFQIAGAQQSNPARRGAGHRQMSREEESSEEDSEASDDDSEEEEGESQQSSSDDVGSGARVRDSPPGQTPIVVEAEPEAQPVRRNPPRASASASTSSKRKPASRGRRKK
ncbi:hypothetical protein FDECE_5093 [Fusarium decemcellulare]|nr:hypothetical protein FDECE_5093 [Fusarium decemcellulare]